MTLELIIPAYNCEKTVRRTLNSLVDQTNKEFSVLVVDDHSTQDIASIVLEYKDQLDIRYIRNSENRGCGMTRQAGIDETKADYIAFLDSDDLLLANAVQMWRDEIQNSRPEVIFSPFLCHSESVHITFDQLGFCHGKVYKAEFLREYDIGASEEIKCADDSFLNWQVFDLAQKASFLTVPTYLYVRNEESVSYTLWFRKRIWVDRKRARQLAREKIGRFKENSFATYKKRNWESMLLVMREAKNYETIICNLNSTINSKDGGIE